MSSSVKIRAANCECGITHKRRKKN